MELPSRRIYSVSELTDQIKATLESNFTSVWVRGEVSNYKKAPSGHVYFTLKDESSQIRCVMFKLQSRFMKFRVDDGLNVIAWGRLSVYGPRGDYQLIVDTMEPAGIGSLMLSFEQLKMKLAAEGLFDEKKKRILPKSPGTVGVVTSSTGAAVRDIIKIIHRRSPNINVLVSPASVQGDRAPQEIVEALGRILMQADVDVIIIGRGGGSTEDLWAFNSEDVVRAVAFCPKPIVSAVGHETDFTLTDFAADVRASTPSAAAELVAPDAMEQKMAVEAFFSRLKSSVYNSLERRLSGLQELRRRLYDPRRSIVQKRQQLDEMAIRLGNIVLRSLEARSRDCADLNRRLRIDLLTRKLALCNDETQVLISRFSRLINLCLDQARSSLKELAEKMDNLSPLKTLARGYSIAFRLDDGRMITDSDTVALGESLRLKLARGELITRVEQKIRNQKEKDLSGTDEG